MGITGDAEQAVIEAPGKVTEAVKAARDEAKKIADK